MTNERLDVLVSIPVGMPKYVPDVDYEKIPCEKCRRAMWAGPKQREMKAEKPEVPFLCLICVVEAQQQINIRSEGTIALPTVKCLNPEAKSRFDP